MSFTIKYIELLDSEDSYVSNKNTLIADMNGNIYLRRPILRKKPLLLRRIDRIEIKSILGKRKTEDVFQGDEERYGQKIEADFFQRNIGHGV